jgi:hypothetical protein
LKQIVKPKASTECILNIQYPLDGLSDWLSAYLMGPTVDYDDLIGGWRCGKQIRPYFWGYVQPLGLSFLLGSQHGRNGGYLLIAHAFSFLTRHDHFHLTKTPLVCSDSQRNVFEAKFPSTRALTNSIKVFRGFPWSQSKCRVGTQIPRCSVCFTCSPPNGNFKIFV